MLVISQPVYICIQLLIKVSVLNNLVVLVKALFYRERFYFYWMVLCICNIVTYTSHINIKHKAIDKGVGDYFSENSFKSDGFTI
jgi:hypothetical protein